MVSFNRNQLVNLNRNYLVNLNRNEVVNLTVFYTVNAKEGKTYYIRLSPAYGLTTGKASFDIIEPEKAQEYIKKFPKPKVKYVD